MHAVELTSEEQIALAEKAKSGCNESANQLICSLYALVVRIASGFLEQSAGFELDDIVQEGLIAANESFRYFDSTRGYKVSTYAADCVRKRIWRFLHTNRSKPLPQEEETVSGIEGGLDGIEGATDSVMTALRLEEFLATVSPLQRKVLELNYGVNGDRVGIEDLSGRLGLRKDAVSDIRRSVNE